MAKKISIILLALFVVFAVVGCKEDTPAGSKDVHVTGVTLNTTNITLEKGHTEQLRAIVEPDNATNKDVTWHSTATDIATVEDGLVTAIKAGQATITVTTADGSKIASCSVSVTDQTLPALSGTITITNTTTNVTLKAADEVTVQDHLEATYSGTETVNFQWVVNGIPGPKSDSTPNRFIPSEAGTIIVRISAEGYNNKDSFEFTVKAATPPLYKIFFNGELGEGVTLDGGLVVNAGNKTIAVPIVTLTDGTGKLGNTITFKISKAQVLGTYKTIEVEWDLSGGVANVDGVGGYRNRFVSSDNKVKSFGFDWDSDWDKRDRNPLTMRLLPGGPNSDYDGSSNGDYEAAFEFVELTIQWGKIMWSSWGKESVTDAGVKKDEPNLIIKRVELKD